MRASRAVAALVLLAGFASAQAGDLVAPELAVGRWDATLASPGGPLAFGLRLSTDGTTWRAWLVNGVEQIEIPEVRWDGRRLTLGMPHYDSRIGASLREVDGALRLDGMWTKRTGRDDFARLLFSATPPGMPVDVADGDAPPVDGGAAPRDTPAGDGAAPRASGDAADISGRWRVDFASDEQPAVGVFEQSGADLSGTFLTTTGDYRFLAGRVEDGVFRLSCFDGAHAFLFEARLDEEGALHGDFWSRDSWHDTWTAVRDEDIALPDGFQLSRWTGAADLGSLAFPDVTGHVRTLADSQFAGRARILQLFGSWCPNCHDASDLLTDLHRRYGPRGLSVVGLAFELTGDFRRDAEQVLRYAERHGVGYPLLVAGRSDKAAASEVFPLLDRVRAYPTTVFLHGDGRVRAVYTGFSGPATGEAHDVLVASFEALVEELLLESEEAEGGVGR